MGTLMPTPRVSVPQTTWSSPRWASCSTRRRYFGSIPAWWTPIPWRTNRFSVRPNPGENRNLAMWVAISSRCSRLATGTDRSDWARSSAAAWVKWTT